MERPQIRATIERILVDQLQIDKEEVKDDAIVEDDLGADSLDIVEILMAVEESYEIEIPDDVLYSEKGEAKHCTVGNVIDYIAKRLGIA